MKKNIFIINGNIYVENILLNAYAKVVTLTEKGKKRVESI